MTFVATALAVMQVGATVVLVDVDDDTLLMTADAAARAVTPRTRAIVPVHLYGQMCDVAALRRALPDRVAIVEDAAQAHGARRDGASPGSATLAATHSFYPGKNLGALGDGGAVLTDDAELATKLARLRNYGQAEKYLHTEIGLNSRLDELQAALLRVRLRGLAAGNARRADIAARYTRALGDVAGLHLLGVPAGSAPVWHVYPVRHAKRDALAAALRERGIGTLVHYPRALHQQPALASLAGGSFPVAERAARELLSLPMGISLSDAEVDTVVDAVKRACRSLA
jgi:dTDP-3-amino-3,4,6-trideoxy-alpha-D-glucose transaminase